MAINIFRCKEDLQKNPGILLFDQRTQSLPIFDHAFLNPNVNNSSRIPESSILKAIHHMQCLGMTDYQDIQTFNYDTLFVNSIGRTISPESLRQRLDIIGRNNNLLPSIDRSIALQLKNASLRQISFFDSHFIPFDIDVTPFTNPNVHKEGISRTYKGVKGFSPIMAYLGSYAVCFDLREGSQHSEKDAPEFVCRCFQISGLAGVNPSDTLVRVDSAHDDYKFVDACEAAYANYLIKRNFRGASQRQITRYAKLNVKPVLSADGRCLIYRFTYNLKPAGSPKCQAYSVFEVREVIRDEHGQDPFALLRIHDRKSPLYGCESPEMYEVDSWWTNLPRPEGVDDRKVATRIICTSRNFSKVKIPKNRLLQTRDVAKHAIGAEKEFLSNFFTIFFLPLRQKRRQVSEVSCRCQRVRRQT